MRRPMIIATTAAGAVLAAGLIAGPALAAAPGQTTTCPQDGTRSGYGMGSGTGYGMGSGTGYGMGPGMGPGDGTGRGPADGRGMRNGPGMTGDPLANLTQGTLSAAQKTALAGMAEEEKLAHDVYVALARTSGDTRFTRIAAAEARHLAEVRALLARYGVADPTAGRADGVFASASVQQQYTAFVARGDDSAAAALAVGRDIERADVAALAAARTGVTAPDVLAVYDRLSAGSARHLAAFGG